MARAEAASKERRRFLIVASSGGGGDLQPLLALAKGLRARGHDVAAFGDDEVQRTMRRLGVDTTLASAEHDLAVQYAAVAREESDLSPVEQAASLRDRLSTNWAPRLKPLIEAAAKAHRSEILVASLFSAGPVRLTAESAGLRWAAVNSTFYVGPDPPRPPEEDFGSRAPLFAGYFAPNMHQADRVMHASDRAFDFDFSGLPKHHCYVGPLLDDAPGNYPPWIDEPGDPWALITVSSLKQDDIVIARCARWIEHPPAARSDNGRPACRTGSGALAAERAHRAIRAARAGIGQGTPDGEPRRARVGDASAVARRADGAGPLGA